MKVVSCTKYLPELFANSYLSDKKITIQDLKDIEKGKKLLNLLNQKFDVGQSAIISNGYVVAIEAAEGTDEMLSKSTKILKKINRVKQSGILLKFPKKFKICELICQQLVSRLFKNALILAWMELF